MDQQEHQHQDLQHQQLHDEQHLQHPENRRLENLQLLENRQLENQQHPENRQLENLQLLDENLQHFEHMQETAQPQPHLMPYPGYYSLGSSLYYGTGPMHGPSSNTSRKIWQEQTLSDDQQVSVRGSRDSRMNVRHWGRRKLSVTRIEMNTERPASRSSTNDFEPLTCRSSMRAMNQSQLSDEQHRLLQQEYALHSRQLHEEQQRHLGRLKELTDHLLLHLMPVPYQEYYTLGSNINGPGPMHAPAIPHGVCDESDSDSSESDTSQESWQN